MELVIVVTIIGIVAAMALPMFGQTHSSRIRAAADLISADIGYVQVDAIAHADDPRQLVLDTENGAYMLTAASAPDTPLTNPIGGIPYLTQFGVGRAKALSGVTIASATMGDDNRIQFGSFGQLDQAETAYITLASNDTWVMLAIDSVSGEVTIGQLNEDLTTE